MSGLVMGRENGSLIILTKDGDFKMVKNVEGLTVGDEYHFETKKPNRFRKYVAIAASMIFIMFSVYGVDAYYTPIGHVNVDINPSVDVTYNRFLRVIDIKGINEDGEILVASLDSMKNRKVKKVVEEVVDAAENLEYITENKENYVLLSVTDKKGKLDTDELMDDDEDIETMIISTTEEEYAKAKEKGFSPGKLKLIEKIKEKAEEKGMVLEESDVVWEEYDMVLEEIKKPVKDIHIGTLMKALNANEKGKENSNKKNENSNDKEQENQGKPKGKSNNGKK